MSGSVGRPALARCLRLGAVGAFGGALMLALLPGVAAASAPVRSGWWDLTPAGGGAPPTTLSGPPQTTLPTPPETTLPGTPTTTLPTTTLPTTTLPGTTVPSASGSGTLEVGYDGAGDTAIAAVEYTVSLTQAGTRIDPTTIDALLTLTLPTAGAAGIPTLLACPTTSAWATGGNQPASKAPRYDCSGGHAARGVYDSGGGTVDWNLGSAQESSTQPGVFAVAIVPAATSPTGVFNATFDRPDAQSFQLMSWAPAGSGGSTPPVTEPPPPGGGPVPSSVPAGGGGSAVGAGAPSSYTGTPAGSSSGAPSALGPASGSFSKPPSAPVGAGVPAASSSLLPRVGKVAASILRFARDVAIGLLIALGLALAAASGRSGRAPRLLVPVPARPGGPDHT